MNGRSAYFTSCRQVVVVPDNGGDDVDNDGSNDDGGGGDNDHDDGGHDDGGNDDGGYDDGGDGVDDDDHGDGSDDQFMVVTIMEMMGRIIGSNDNGDELVMRRN